jgi:molybdate/tungstate transport system substrate-binding protein
VLAAAAMAGCGPATGTAGYSPASPPGRGPVEVLYAGSLVKLMEDRLGPDFAAATGYRFVGFAGGSSQLANEVKGGVRQGDVLVSASPGVDESLRGARNGGWVSWYATFATSPLVLGYDPASRFASQLRTRPWYEVVTEQGFQLGRTDPADDPKGALTVAALRRAASVHRDHALAALAQGTGSVFPEETLLGRLQAGQLDAGFFYRSETDQAGIPTVPLGLPVLGASYTVTVLERAPHPGAAGAFVAYLLGPNGSPALRHAGLEVLRPPRLSGPRSAVPPTLRRLVSR